MTKDVHEQEQENSPQMKITNAYTMADFNKEMEGRKKKILRKTKLSSLKIFLKQLGVKSTQSMKNLTFITSSPKIKNS